MCFMPFYCLYTVNNELNSRIHGIVQINNASLLCPFICSQYVLQNQMGNGNGPRFTFVRINHNEFIEIKNNKMDFELYACDSGILRRRQKALAHTHTYDL